MLSEGFTKFLIGLGAGALLIGFVMFCYKDSLFQFQEQIKSDKIGQLGDFVGGIAGSIWALAGVILFYVALQSQKEALNDQKLATQATIDAVEKQNDSLKLQIEEIALQREEMGKSTEAQNKSQLALNHQLKNMQLTSQIDVLNQFIDLYQNRGKDEHVNLSKEIIEHLTNQIFYSPEYYEFVKPTYKVHSKSFAKIMGKSEKYNHTIKLQAVNAATQNVELKNDELKDVLHITNKVGKTGIKGIYEFKYAAEKKDREFEIEYKGAVVPNKYRQIISVADDEVTISDVELVESVYHP